MSNIQKLCDDIIKWMKDKVEEAGSKGLVFGLSGGIDSAVMAGLAKKAFPDDALGIIMPCHSNPEDEEHARLVAKALNLNTKTIELTKVYDLFLNELKDDTQHVLALSNIKPRFRMTTLYYFAQIKRYLVAGTSNKSEFTVGYFTKHGDSGVDILPMVDLLKEEVFQLASYLNIPDIIINKPPTAGLWEDQTDEKEMGFSYRELDGYIKSGEAEESIKVKIEKMHIRSQHKRRFPLMYIREE
ncbi:NAD+ synthase [Proteiniborus ethanoligenes]|uniref:NH(3)-dependent NAD(+) synthetase n=1 Tax=Proteiniborus ethanoligenes TaxID=415015 RepID=A0A1H3QRZ5_9FIRM|nr:NAD(+) synthase [Proteiniborus ethanoligenes]SDZ15768.1 NAD+ synthase [Proteiniborus ethanoligenes]